MKKFSLLLSFFILISWQVFAQTGKKSETGSDKSVNPIPGSSLVRIGKENHIHKMSINNKPCISVKDGTRLVFECWDALEGRSKEYFDNPHVARGNDYSNPATGPIFIEGALPGNALEIEIHDIRLSKSGFKLLYKNQFLDNADKEVIYNVIEVEGDQILYNGRKMPVQSMVGVIGVAGLNEIWTQEVGDNGSNMDTRIIKKGSKVILPVVVEGALFAMGDTHAVMGDGEITGSGVEIGADIEVTVRVRKDLKIRRPMIINPDRIACIASNTDILVAKDQVIQDMGKYLVDMCGFSSVDASALIAFYGNLRFCQVVNPQKTIRMEIEKKYIDLFAHKALPVF